MSARYSTSPTLHLTIADSSRYRYCQWLGCLTMMLAVINVACRGYPFFWLLLPLLPIACYLNRRQPLAGAELGWQQGQWSLQADGERQLIDLQRGHCLPWVTYLAWRDQVGGRGSLFLFSDSASHQQLRRLRVRLRLQRGI